MIHLTVPYLLLFVLITTLVCIFRKKYVASVFILILAIVCNFSYKVFSINIMQPNEDVERVIRVMSFNTNGSGERTVKSIKNIANFVLDQSPDVLFIAEDFDAISNSLDSFLVSRYPYSNYQKKNAYGGHYFYSKYPLGTVEHIEIESNRFSYCYHCKMAYGNDSINLFGVHMASNNYKGTEASIRPEDIDGIKNFSNYLDNIEAASLQRCEEVTKVRDMSIKTGGPTIIMGDFNDVSGSRPLNILEDAGFKDAWWEGGFGYGATIHHPLPFRIDHIMYNDGVKLVDVKKIDANGLSDHDAMVATFILQK